MVSRPADSKAATYSRGEEIFNMVTHIVGGGLAIAATALCVVFAALRHNVWGVVGCSVFGATMILLYTMSSVYHGLKPETSAKRVLRVLDHCTIFVLIAGTYTPFSLVTLRAYSAALGWSVFGVIWGLAVLGIVFTAVNLERFRVFSGILYLVMGWLVLFTIRPVAQAVGLGGMLMLVGGGLCYTAGAGVYHFARGRAYAHGVFHLLVIAGSVLHSLCILFYVI
ncbi:MAG: hemolysin III family protein [Clostridia bacterium]|nr:hemolysin III family protein [Clostridia bacterium]